MGFRTGSYATIWKLENKGKYYVAEMSTSKKVKDASGNEVIENGKAKYETDWSNKFVRLVGSAAKQIAYMGEKDRYNVKIDSCDVTTTYDAEKKLTYTNYVIFSFAEDNNSTPVKSKNSDGFMNIPDGIPDGIDDELPFN